MSAPTAEAIARNHGRGRDTPRPTGVPLRGLGYTPRGTCGRAAREARLRQRRPSCRFRQREPHRRPGRRTARPRLPVTCRTTPHRPTRSARSHCTSRRCTQQHRAATAAVSDVSLALISQGALRPESSSTWSRKSPPTAVQGPRRAQREPSLRRWRSGLPGNLRKSSERPCLYFSERQVLRWAATPPTEGALRAYGAPHRGLDARRPGHVGD